MDDEEITKPPPLVNLEKSSEHAYKSSTTQMEGEDEFDF